MLLNRQSHRSMAWPFWSTNASKNVGRRRKEGGKNCPVRFAYFHSGMDMCTYARQPSLSDPPAGDFFLSFTSKEPSELILKLLELRNDTKVTSKKTAYSAYSKFCRWYRTYLAQEIVSAYKYFQSLSLKSLTTFEQLYWGIWGRIGSRKMPDPTTTTTTSQSRPMHHEIMSMLEVNLTAREIEGPRRPR